MATDFALTDRYLKEMEQEQLSAASKATIRRPKYLPNQLHVLPQMPRTLYVPIYVRAYLQQLINVSLAEEKVKAHFTILVTYPVSLNAQIFADLKSQEIDNITKLSAFLKNNLALQVGGQYIDIVNDSFPKKRLVKASSLNNSHLKFNHTLFRDSGHTSLQTEDQEAYTEQFFISCVYNLHSNHYVTYKIQGHFHCDNTLGNIFFPYHDLLCSLNIRVHQLFYRDITIRYNIMNCGQDQEKFQLFALKLHGEGHSKFGIYNVNRNYQKITWERGQQDMDGQFNDQTVEIVLVESISFGFKIYSYNMPFILRYEIPIWTLCLASVLLYFSNAQNIGNVYANIILLAIAEITLVSNFRSSSYKSEIISLYEFTLLGFIVMLLLLIIHETQTFYGPNIEGNQKSYYFVASMVIAIGLFIVNLTTITVLGVQSKYAKKKHTDQGKYFVENLMWNEYIFASCVSFRQQEGESETQRKSNGSSEWYDYD